MPRGSVGGGGRIGGGGGFGGGGRIGGGGGFGPRTGGGGFGSGSRPGGSGFSSRGPSSSGRAGGSGRMGSSGRTGGSPGSFGRGGGGGPGYSGRPGGMGPMGGGFRAPPPHRHGRHHYHSPRRRYYFPFFGPRRYYRFGRGRVSGGCLSTVMTAMILFVVLGAVLLSLSWGVFSGIGAAGGAGSSSVGGGGGTPSTVTASTIKRDRIKDSKWSLGIYDDLNWLNVRNTTPGLKSFWKATGVVPYIMIVDIHGALYSQYNGDLEELARNEYDKRLSDENGLLFVLAVEDEGNEFDAYMQPGYNAVSVMDSEARDILSSYFLFWWNKDTSIVNDSQVVSGAFADAGKQIMKAGKPVWVIAVVAVAAVIIIIVAFNFWKKKRELDAERDETAKTILNTPLDTIPTGGDDTANKYL